MAYFNLENYSIQYEDDGTEHLVEIKETEEEIEEMKYSEVVELIKFYIHNIINNGK